MKVSELIGESLDHWVARAEGYASRAHVPDEKCGAMDAGESDGKISAWCPSSNWFQAGPIIYRESIGLYDGTRWGEPGKPPNSCIWFACVGGAPNYGAHLEGPGEEFAGPTPLVAAMRAYVGSKFGNEVYE
ncbi:phage protein NinX family protein [Achromobacter xylosoxidans]